MKGNCIEETGLQIYSAGVMRDPNPKNGLLHILITEEYIKANNYQKSIKEYGCFFVGGNLLYLLLSELFEHITVMFSKIRMDDVDIHDENRTLLFLRKFSRSSETIEAKIHKILKVPREIPYEIFEIRLAGLQNNINFSRSGGQESKMSIAIPVHYLYNRLISHMDKMQFTDLPQLDKEIRERFLQRFNELNQKVRDKKHEIEVKYALELAQERISDLEKENTDLHQKMANAEYQCQLYKRSYMSLKQRYEKVLQQVQLPEEDEVIEEL